MSLKANNKAPNFRLPNQNDEFFYPKDNTPGCTKEAIGFSQNLDKINKLGYLVFGISKDTTKKHRSFTEKQNLLVDLLSDYEKDTCEKYGVWVEKSMYGKKYFGIERTTFIINERKKIINVWNKVKVPGHIEEILSFLKKK